ncbi:alpha/beta hydrolase [Aliiroseovarius sp. Z3]|uniref:alpha/beta hydrolase n=1 Tax=Aliiroseovarius sp. Z3 TaxID=2811402 RepID=UPI0023B21657|nr:alpha/beta hydrolase [Aliiroseovarius sp. Z3]MDE9451261.1 alpha/beta hydrolase [Aliiroseovarius sp. Z3]
MSWQLSAAKLCGRLFVKTRLRHLNDVTRARHELEHAANWMFRAPPFAWYREAKLGGALKTLWIETRPVSHPAPMDKVILYLHGGGFVAGSPNTHRKMLARLSWLTGLRVCAPDYRKAPEHPFPAALDDCIAAYEALIADGYDPQNIIVGGDSAGGGLTFSLLAQIDGRLPAPRAVFAFSPIVDLRFTSPAFENNKTKDPLLPSERRDLVVDNYLGPNVADDERASPVLHGFNSPPPALLQFSTTEILRDESLRMAEVLRAAGGHVELDEWPDAPHVWVILDGWVPEAREALRRAAKFITRQFRDGIQGES